MRQHEYPSGRELTKLSDDDIVNVAREYGFLGISPSEARREWRALLEQVNKRKLEHRIFQYKIVLWNKLSDEELLQIATDRGLVGMSYSQVTQFNASYFQEMKSRGLHEKVFVRKKDSGRSYNRLTDDELVEFALSRGLYGLTFAEARKKAPYFYEYVTVRGIKDRIFKPHSNSPALSDVNIKDGDESSNEPSLRENPEIDMLRDDELIEMCKKEGLFGKDEMHAYFENRDLLNEVRRRGIQSKVFSASQDIFRSTFLE